VKVIENVTIQWRAYDFLLMFYSISRVVSEIFNVEKCRDHEIWVRSHSRSLKVVPFNRSGMVSY